MRLDHNDNPHDGHRNGMQGWDIGAVCVAHRRAEYTFINYLSFTRMQTMKMMIIDAWLCLVVAGQGHRDNVRGWSVAKAWRPGRGGRGGAATARGLSRCLIDQHAASGQIVVVGHTPACTRWPQNSKLYAPSLYTVYLSPPILQCGNYNRSW